MAEIQPKPKVRRLSPSINKFVVGDSSIDRFVVYCGPDRTFFNKGRGVGVQFTSDTNTVSDEDKIRAQVTPDYAWY